MNYYIFKTLLEIKKNDYELFVKKYKYNVN